jgi:hypothetical protein
LQPEAGGFVADLNHLAEAIAALPEGALDADGSGAAPLGEQLLRLADVGRLRIMFHETLAALGWQGPAAVAHLQWAPIARARLEASLTGATDELLDGQPFPGEWSVRQQLAHVELTDVRYGIATLYAAKRREDEPVIPPAGIYPSRQGEPAGNPGEPLSAILARMRRVRAEAMVPLLGLSAEQLLRPTEWHTAEHTVGFRLHRFAQHDLELATDMQRTLAALGHRPSRAMGIAAAVVEARGELESVLLGVPQPLYDREPPAVGQSLNALLQAMRDEAARVTELALGAR